MRNVPNHASNVESHDLGLRFCGFLMIRILHWGAISLEHRNFKTGKAVHDITGGNHAIARRLGIKLTRTRTLI